MEKIKLDSIQDAIDDIKRGKIIIVVDDEDRENEGDFICAAEHITPEIVNFMRKEAGGYLCCALPDQRAKELELGMMVGKNTDPNKTAFTVTVDLLGQWLHYGNFRFRPSQNSECACQPEHATRRIGQTRTHQPVGGDGWWSFEKGGTHRSRFRFCPIGWLATRWLTD